MSTSNSRSLSRRSAIVMGGGALASVVAACSSSSTKPKPSKSGSSSSPVTVAVQPVDGFTAKPIWTSAQAQELAGWKPLVQAGSVWFANRAWILVQKGSETRILAFDPSSKTIALSTASVPAGSDIGDVGTPWWPIKAPKEALILNLGASLMRVGFSGSSISVDPLPQTPSTDGSGAPTWLGDGIIVVQENNSYAATGDVGDATNQASPSFYLDPTKKSWTAMHPQHDGTIYGISASDGKVTPVEITTGGDSNAPVKAWVGSRSFESGFPAETNTPTASYPPALSAVEWSSNGTLLMSVRKDSDTSHVVYGPDGKAKTGLDSTKGSWATPKSTYALTQKGVAVNLTSGRTGHGVQDDVKPAQWELSNSTISSDGTIYANAKTQPGDLGLPRGGSYVSKTGAIAAEAHTAKDAPALVLPNGDGLFLKDEGFALLAKS